MIDALRRTIAARSGIADWKISETRRSGSERYFIGNRLDLCRSVDARDYRLTIYVDGEADGAATRGDASVTIHPTMGKTELEASVERAAFAASMCRNPWYALPGPRPASIVARASRFEDASPASHLPGLAEALYSARGPAGSRINSLELFLTRIERRILNSRGVDASWASWSGYTEYVTETAGRDGPVELIDDFAFAEPDGERLVSEISRRLEFVAARAEARPTPALAGLPLILSGREAAKALGWFMANLSGARVYSKSSPFAIGESIHGQDAAIESFDPLTLNAEAEILGSPLSAPFDGEGVPLSRALCAEAGIARAIIGPSRYAQYLDLPILGDFCLFSIGPGSRSPEVIRAEPHLEGAFFSDFRVDADSGDFGGEIRLAWYFDGRERRPVTGGSVTGGMMENRAYIRLSDAICRSGPMLGPEAILLPRVSVTGAG